MSRSRINTRGIKLQDKQRGVVMLAFILLVVTAASFMLISQVNTISIKHARSQHDARILAEAKEALIAYATTYQETAGSSPPNHGKHGFLPCPDIDETTSIDEGGSHGTCGNRYVSSMGRYPWRSLGLQPLKDSAGECLWYAVSGQYKSSGTSSPEMLNADTNGSFEIYDSDGSTIVAGNSPEDRPVAVIFAPGDVIGNQDRTDLVAGTEICGGHYEAAEYLDAENQSNPGSGIRNYYINSNADQIDKFIISGDKESHVFNDRLIYITRQELWDAINRRNDFPDVSDTADTNDFYDMTEDYSDLEIENTTKWIAACIAKYGNTTTYNRSLPYPAPVDVDTNVTAGDYRDDQDYIDLGSSYHPPILTDYSATSGIPLFGRVPNSIDVTEHVANKGIGNLITGCDLTVNTPNGLSPVTAAEQEKYLNIWKNWKDHYFYAVADVFQPRPTSTWQNCLVWGVGICVCGNGARCVNLVDNGGTYQDDNAAIVIFAGNPHSNDNREAPPLDASNQKGNLQNYIDNNDNINTFQNYVNSATLNDNISFRNYDTDPMSNYNDVIYCINDNDASVYFEIRRCEISN